MYGRQQPPLAFPVLAAAATTTIEYPKCFQQTLFLCTAGSHPSLPSVHWSATRIKLLFLIVVLNQTVTLCVCANLNRNKIVHNATERL